MASKDSLTHQLNDWKAVETGLAFLYATLHDRRVVDAQRALTRLSTRGVTQDPSVERLVGQINEFADRLTHARNRTTSKTIQTTIALEQVAGRHANSPYQ